MLLRRALSSSLPGSLYVTGSSRWISSTSIRRNADQREVPVVTYVEDGQSSESSAQRSTLKDDNSRSSRSTEVKNRKNENALSFDPGPSAGMTPTMRSFTLEGKVAIVTGYAKVLR